MDLPHIQSPPMALEQQGQVCCFYFPLKTFGFHLGSQSTTTTKDMPLHLDGATGTNTYRYSLNKTMIKNNLHYQTLMCVSRSPQSSPDPLTTDTLSGTPTEEE